MRGVYFFGLLGRNAYIQRNTLSDCVFLGSRTFEYAPRRKALSFASCLYLRVLTVTFFSLFGRNANLRRSALSALRLLRVMYFCVHSPRTSAGSASCLYLRVLTVTFFGLFGRNAYILCNTLSPLRFCPFSRLMVRGGGTPPHASPMVRGCRTHQSCSGKLSWVRIKPMVRGCRTHQSCLPLW